MNIIHLDSHGLHAHEVREGIVLECLSEHAEHLALHDALPEDAIFVLTGASFTARFAIHDAGSHRRVTLLDYKDIH